ncbi:agmatine deiminase family protein [Porifericola rhodea]|uniref:agmatine deiminase family protein n=1 Tax=Porifericola rhodea TaxID=930972 RepID=UPI0026665A9D|nr:agmatine deiminase family protein [Porifericola rhodea]WKN32351.1 agmatine deiminase family protein [Porifericola rhodea]
MNTSTFFPAEWHPQSAIQLTWPHAGTDWFASLHEVLECYVEIARNIAERQKLLIICHEPEEVKTQLKGCNLDNIRLHKLPTNDTWARDHGGITLIENGEPVLLDFRFNGWGLKFAANHDNLLTRRMYLDGLFNKSVHYRNCQHMVLEGGALESDGEGTLLTTVDCLMAPNRNDHLNKEDIEEELKKIFKLKRILWLHYGYLEGDDTDSHVDTLARFCDPQTIAYVQCQDRDDPHFEALQKMEQELLKFRTIDEESYRLVPLPMADIALDEDGHRLPATYANFLIINGAVLLPFYANEVKNQQAKAALESAFPQHEIIGINCEPLIQQHGSLHCITMQYPVGVIAEENK